MRSDRLRFEVGQRVQCHMGGGRWESGLIIQLFYEPGEEDEGPFAAAGLQLTFPYQARLDRGSFHDQPRNIFATADADHCIRLPDGIVDDGNAGYDAFEEESLDLGRFEFSPPAGLSRLRRSAAARRIRQNPQRLHAVLRQVGLPWVQCGVLPRSEEAGHPEGTVGQLCLCRSPPYTADEERNDSLRILCDRGSATVMGILAFAYNTGTHGVERMRAEP